MRYVAICLDKKGNSKFTRYASPIIVTDVNGDKYLIVAGNDCQRDVVTCKYDAFHKLVCGENGKGRSNPASISETCFMVNGDVKSIKSLDLKNG